MDYFFVYKYTMRLENKSKINRLIADWPVGAIYVTSWLKNAGISNQLLNRYKKSNWLSPVAPGALKRFQDEVTYQGAIYALQKQLDSSIHIGAKTALELQGKAHYLQLGNATATLFGGSEDKLPTWFNKADWKVKTEYYSTSFLPPELGLVDFELETFSVKISNPARAIMECLYLAPKKQELMECYELLEGLGNLRPQQVQALLEACTSVKVKRLFLFLSEKANHSWFEYLDISKIDLGSGKRSIVPNGVFNAKYQITVPIELA
ncbi:MAG TPA: type IV toxin-antitoxin system AbiEi family antitoxin [Methylotenera sp.]|nr:type IV toxin-antitoxin system AbiEi family antitoxin [Methylotenera sp.]